ncbi:MAG: hypothetical protein WDN00_14715 [Limisphaerales bacterium]
MAEKNGYGESIAALFALPFILFSMAGGFLADRFQKRSVMLGVKIFGVVHHVARTSPAYGIGIKTCCSPVCF